MQTCQYIWSYENGWNSPLPSSAAPAELLLVFGTRRVLEQGHALQDVRCLYPDALLVGCSTSGEIEDTRIRDDTLVASAVSFSSTVVAGAVVPCAADSGAISAGKALARALDPQSLVHVLVLSNGIGINGSELVQGMASVLPENVPITGGLAGDGQDFGQTVVVLQDSVASDTVVAVGFYGQRLRVGYGSLGGWDQFGPERIITRSKGNVLYGLDEMSALELYKTYLGEHARGLPATGLFFPLEVRSSTREEGVVRTILAVDEQHQSMTFAGDMPEGAYARLMKANFDRLIDGAADAASGCLERLGDLEPQLAICISCVGRRMVLKQRAEEELEAVRETLGPATTLAGFYSYGEICPCSSDARCELHNQTMTITAFAEAD